MSEEDEPIKPYKDPEEMCNLCHCVSHCSQRPQKKCWEMHQEELKQQDACERGNHA
jgi:hypothetical protein